MLAASQAQECTRPSRRDNVSQRTHLRTPHPRTPAPAHAQYDHRPLCPRRPPSAHPIQRKSDGPRLPAFLVSAPKNRHVARMRDTRRTITMMVGALGAAGVHGLGRSSITAQGTLLEREQPASVALFDVLRRKVRAWENTYTN
jgi:hypothetical protein